MVTAAMEPRSEYQKRDALTPVSSASDFLTQQATVGLLDFETRLNDVGIISLHDRADMRRRIRAASKIEEFADLLFMIVSSIDLNYLRPAGSKDQNGLYSYFTIGNTGLATREEAAEHSTSGAQAWWKMLNTCTSLSVFFMCLSFSDMSVL